MWKLSLVAGDLALTLVVNEEVNANFGDQGKVAPL